MAERISWRSVVGWDRAGETVIAREERRLGALVLAQRPLPQPEPEALLDAMLEGVREMRLESLPWNEEARQLQARLLSVRQWLPEEGWPDLSDAQLLATLEEWLAPYLSGMNRREHLSRLNLAEILRNTLDWDKQQCLEQAAPTHLQVPSGSRK